MPKKVTQCVLCHRTDETHYISKEAGICTTCEASLRYWRDKSPTRIMRRVKQVESFQNRMSTITGDIGKLNKRRK